MKELVETIAKALVEKPEEVVVTEIKGDGILEVKLHVAQSDMGKTISYVAMVLKPKEFPKGYFVPGRMAMTCCADDMAFLGFACKYDKLDELKEKQWIKVTAKVTRQYFSDYDGEGPVLEAIKIEPASKPKEEVISFN